MDETLNYEKATSYNAELTSAAQKLLGALSWMNESAEDLDTANLEAEQGRKLNSSQHKLDSLDALAAEAARTYDEAQAGVFLAITNLQKICQERDDIPLFRRDGTSYIL